jgi:hypothetical protein
MDKGKNGAIISVDPYVDYMNSCWENIFGTWMTGHQRKPFLFQFLSNDKFHLIR